MASLQETANSPENAAKMSADDIERALDSGPFATWAQPLAALAVAVAEAKPARVVSPAEFLRRCVDGGARCVDVRSPAEFARDAVPGAHSAPLFDDAERADVGKCYAKKGRDEAMRLGLAKLRKKGGLGELAERVAGDATVVGVYCWRGGLRSGSVAWLLARRNVDVFVLDGGYRAYRRHLRELFEQGPRVIIVGGRTGVGKTRVLRALAAKNHQVLDLEALAAHRGSAFGDLKGAAQPSNAAFETKCAWAWRALDATRDVFVEDEEGHVGRCLVPPALYARMRAAPRVVRVDASDAARVAHLLEDYAEDEAAGAGGARARLDAALALVAKRLGPDDTARAKQFLDAGDLAACARLLLARYYDKLYDRHLGRRGDAVLAVRAADPFDAGAVADAVVAAVSRADAADLPPPPPVEATRPPPRDRDDDGVQWCAPS
jgi:tRNA 2-selenouridine synthase